MYARTHTHTHTRTHTTHTHTHAHAHTHTHMHTHTYTHTRIQGAPVAWLKNVDIVISGTYCTSLLVLSCNIDYTLDDYRSETSTSKM